MWEHVVEPLVVRVVYDRGLSTAQSLQVLIFTLRQLGRCIIQSFNICLRRIPSAGHTNFDPVKLILAVRVLEENGVRMYLEKFDGSKPCPVNMLSICLCSCP